MSIREDVRGRVAALLSRPLEELRDDVVLTNLVVDSLALVEMAIDVQEDFGVRLAGEDLARVATVGDLIELVAERSSQNGSEGP